MEKMCALGYSITSCKKIWNNCLDLQIRPIFQFIGLPRRDLPFNRSKQQNSRTISGAIGGASRGPWPPWAPKIICINLRGRIQTMLTVFELSSSLFLQRQFY